MKVDCRLSNIIELRMLNEKAEERKRQAMQFLVSLFVSISGTVIGGFGLALTLKQGNASTVSYLLISAAVLLISALLYDFLGRLIFRADWGNID